MSSLAQVEEIIEAMPSIGDVGVVFRGCGENLTACHSSYGPVTGPNGTDFLGIQVVCPSTHTLLLCSPIRV